MGRKSAQPVDPVATASSPRDRVNALALPALSPLTLWAAGILAAVLGFARLSYGLLLPAINASLGGDYAVLGGIGTLNFAGYLLGVLLTPVLAARSAHPLRLTVLSLLAMSAAMLGAALSPNLWALAAWRLLVGITSAPATVLTMALTLERIDPRQRGVASGVIWMGGAAGMIGSGLAAPLLLAGGLGASWRLAWVAMGLLAAICAIGFAAVYRANHAAPIPTPVPPAGATRRGMLGAVADPRGLLWLAVAYSLFGAGYICYFTFIVAWLVVQGMPVAQTGLVWAAMGAAGMASGAAWGRAVDRRPRGGTLAAALGLGAAGALAILTALPWAVIAGGVLVGLCCLIAPPLLVTALARRASDAASYTANFSALTACFAVGQIAGPLAGGVAVAYGGLTAGIAAGGLALAGGALAAWAYDRARHTAHEAR